MGESGRFYFVKELIGRGGFGTVHTASICGFQPHNQELLKKLDLKTKFKFPKNEELIQHSIDAKYAIKTEQKIPLKLEIDVLSCANKSVHFCKLIDVGVEPNTDINFMVMTLCGPSLSDMRNALTKRSFSFSTVIRVAMQVRIFI